MHNDGSTNTSVFDNLGTLLSLVPISYNANVLPTTTTLSLASGGKLDLSGHNQQVASLSDYVSGNGGSILNSNSGAASVLTVSPTGGSTTFSGTIVGGGTLGTISLVMNGNGTQVLSGSNTYTGGTTVSGGTLLAATTVSLPGYSTSGSVNVAGGVLAVRTLSGTTTGWSSDQVGSLVANANWNNGVGTLGIDTTQGDFTFAGNITQALALANWVPTR